MVLSGITVDKSGKRANNGLKAGLGDKWLVLGMEYGSGPGGLI